MDEFAASNYLSSATSVQYPIMSLADIIKIQWPKPQNNYGVWSPFDGDHGVSSPPLVLEQAHLSLQKSWQCKGSWVNLSRKHHRQYSALRVLSRQFNFSLGFPVEKLVLKMIRKSVKCSYDQCNKDSKTESLCLHDAT